MSTSYTVRRVVSDGDRLFLDLVIHDDTVGEFNYGIWMSRDEAATLAKIPIGEIAASQPLADIVQSRLPSALVWREQTKAAEEYALAHPDEGV